MTSRVNSCSGGTSAVYRAICVQMASICFLLPFHAAPCFAQPASFVPKQDFLIEAVAASLKETMRDLKISDGAEKEVVMLALRDSSLPISVLSISIMRPSADGITSFDTTEKHYDKHFTIRLSRLVSTDIKTQIAIVNEVSLNEEKVMIKERSYIRHDMKGWQKAPSKRLLPLRVHE